MAARFVDEEREKLRREHEGRRPLLREWSVQRGFGIVPVSRGTSDEIKMLDVFPAALAHEARVVAGGGLAPRFHRKDRQPGARFDDLLRYVGAFARDEVPPRAIRRDGRSPRLDIRTDRRRVDRAQVIDA